MVEKIDLTDLVENTVLLNGIQLHFISSGPADGVPLILLHGFPEFWRGWIHQIKPLAMLGYRVVVPDQRGYNLSEVPANVEDYSLDKLTADILCLADYLGFSQFFLAGHDWGAVVAWNLAIRHPERIKKLAILNVPHPSVMAKHLTKNVRQMLKSWYIGFFQIPYLADWLLSLNHFAGMLSMLRNSSLPTTFSIDNLNEYRQAYQNSRGVTGMINWYRALLRFPPKRAASNHLQMPVLVLWGRNDIALHYDMAVDSMKYCDRGKLKIFDNATHWLQHDEPEAVTEHLAEFFSSTD
jgi:pimeloyl-ACP methyl ester carboxylesterase